MKTAKKIFLVLLVLLLLSAAGIMGYQIYLQVQKTPAEIVEIENQKTELAYKENLEISLNACENYDFIVVLNPAHGGMDTGHENSFGTEKDITLTICNKVAEANADAKVGIFLTRTQDVGMDAAMRLDFVEQIQPDLFIDVHLDKNATVGTYGTSVSYDTTYFNRKLTNAEFADVMEKSVVSAIEGFAVGIIDVTDTDAEEKAVLKGLTVPAVSIACGDMSNEKEGELLTRDNYQSNLANGILEGIRIAKERLE